MLGEAEARNLRAWLGEGEHAVAVVGRGLYSFKGSGYVRGGVFDRIVLIQDDVSVRFRDRDHRRMGPIAAEGAPDFAERDLFRIPADAGFDPTRPFRLQLLVQREVAAIEKVFTTFELGYRLPARYLRVVAPPAPVAQAEDPSEAEAQSALWKRIWEDKTLEIVGLGVMLAILTLAFFFQMQLTRSERATTIFRVGFLTVTPGVPGLVRQRAALGREPDGPVRGADLRLQLAGVPAGSADLHPVVLGRRGAAVLGPGRLLRVAVPLRRPAGADQPRRPQPRRAADQAALGPA